MYTAEKRGISNRLMYNEVLCTKWKERERVRFECTSERNAPTKMYLSLMVISL